jgi:hypothetical protein
MEQHACRARVPALLRYGGLMLSIRPAIKIPASKYEMRSTNGPIGAIIKAALNEHHLDRHAAEDLAAL